MLRPQKNAEMNWKLVLINWSKSVLEDGEKMSVFIIDRHGL